ncbi:galactose-specific lectin nattectin-like [Cyprinodon tularosa]|uniref:galactose-specific lectin nattectin-like n=1 Tax=Cyprinodon tularosa TaxID=77115 RepID=UPI0018E217F9|nr:galactose-specific lectin nattectin-like [Cyprinodon tularosa]
MPAALQLTFLLGSIISLLAVKAAFAQSENLGAAPVCAAPCPPGWTQFGSRCFIFYYESKTWVDAEKFCISIGGNLASIHSSDENTFLSTMVERVTGRTHFTWVGGYDAVNDSTWLWSDGSEFNYENWYPDEPNNHRGNPEHCLEINLGGEQWNDMPCSSSRPFVCSRNL